MINDELVNEVIEDFLKKYGEENRYILADIDKQIAKLYAKYAKDNGLTYLDALKYLTDNERAEFQHDLKYYLESIADKEFYETHKAELQALSVRARVKRLDMLKAYINMSLSEMFGSLLDQSKETLKTVYKAGKSISETEAKAVKSEKIAFDIPEKGEPKIVIDTSAKGPQNTIIKGEGAIKVGNKEIDSKGVITEKLDIEKSVWSQTDDKVLQTLEEFPWSGENYSDKVWENKDELEKALNNELTHGLVTGKSYDEIVSDMQKKLDADKWKIERLVRTEGTFIANQASLRGYEEAGIKYYRFVARLDARTSRICLGMHNQIFEVKDAVAGKNLPPMHPWCRSTTVPVFTQEETDKQKEIDEDNKKIRKEYIEKCKKNKRNSFK